MAKRVITKDAYEHAKKIIVLYEEQLKSKKATGQPMSDARWYWDDPPRDGQYHSHDDNGG